jgi:hypothetical protein
MASGEMDCRFGCRPSGLAALRREKSPGTASQAALRLKRRTVDAANCQPWQRAASVEQAEKEIELSEA